MKLINIYLGDYSAEGYHKGVSDGKLGRPKNFFSALNSLHFANYIWNFKNSYSSYCSNYSNGYEKGLRIREKIYSGNLTFDLKTGDSKMGIYRQHIIDIEHCIAGLISNKRMFDSSIDLYKTQVNTSKSMGFLENYTDKLDEKLATLSSATDETKDKIDILIGYLNHYKEKLEHLERQATENNLD